MSDCSCPCVHCSTGNCWMCHGDSDVQSTVFDGNGTPPNYDKEVF